jgi:hypothetical protein
MKNTINKIHVLYGNGAETYCVGSNGVTEIKDVSVEFDSSLHTIYNVYRGDSLFIRIENCPVVVEFEEEPK